MRSEQAVQTLRQWMLSLHPELSEIPPDLDLITHRVVDSLAFVELVERLMELTGTELDMQTMPVDSFRTLEAIRRNYLAALDAP